MQVPIQILVRAREQIGEEKQKESDDSAANLVDGMVWRGLARADAARELGLTDDYCYGLLRDPQVMAKFREELATQRTAGDARMLRRLEEMAMQDDNLTAAVNAIKTHLAMGANKENAPAVNVAVLTPGWVIDCTAALSGWRVVERLQASPTWEHGEEDGGGLVVDGQLRAQGE